MPKKNGNPSRKHISDLSDDTADLRGSLNLSADAIDGISQDMKAKLEDWKRRHPGRRLPDNERLRIYEDAAAPHGATAEQARLIAFRTNGHRKRPKGYTVRTTLGERPIWGEVAKMHGRSIRAVVSLALACFLTRLGRTDLLALMDPMEDAAD